MGAPTEAMPGGGPNSLGAPTEAMPGGGPNSLGAPTEAMPGGGPNSLGAPRQLAFDFSDHLGSDPLGHLHDTGVDENTKTQLGPPRPVVRPLLMT